jgi:putative transcriptional regulator
MLDATESILKKAGFQVSKRCMSRPSCFDLTVRKGEQLAFLKTFTNVGNITTKDAFELKAISNFFSAAPLFISSKMRGKPLEDDTVYERCNIYAITLKTLEDIVSNNMHPLVEAGPGGYYVSLNGDAIRETRQKLGLSIGKLAEMMGISRRTLYGYEKGMTKASVSAAYSLEWVLGTPLVKPINIFKRDFQSTGFFAVARHIMIRSRFLQAVLKKFAQINFKATPTTKAPFDFVAQFSESQLMILGGVISQKERNVEQRTEEIVSVSKVANAQPVLITDGEEFSKGVPSIRLEDFFKIEDPWEFIHFENARWRRRK